MLADRKFTAIDRCDTCGAQAYYGFEVSGTELIYCAHHGSKYEVTVLAKGYPYRDYRHLLLEDEMATLP